ncbi:MAG: hypothetical protein ABIS17_15140 [Casimicrobiaceae bacterium]
MRTQIATASSSNDVVTPRPTARLPVRVNESLSRGLADRFLDVLAQQGDRYRIGLRAMPWHPPSNKKAIGRIRQTFIQLGERTHLIQVIGSTANARQVTVCQFVPHVVGGSAGRTAPLRFVLNQFVISRHGLGTGPDCGVALAATEHAVERLFQRLNTLDLGAVVGELQDAMLLALPLWTVGLSLRLRQVALPTSSGAFLCDLDPDRPYLRAKTWIANPQIGLRWRQVINAVESAVEAAGGPTALAEVLGTGISQALDDDGARVFAQLAEALASHPWLRNPYVPRVDIVGEAWKRYANHA